MSDLIETADVLIVGGGSAGAVLAVQQPRTAMASTSIRYAGRDSASRRPPSLALDPPQPVRGSPPLDDEHRGLLV